MPCLWRGARRRHSRQCRSTTSERISRSPARPWRVRAARLATADRKAALSGRHAEWAEDICAENNLHPFDCHIPKAETQRTLHNTPPMELEAWLRNIRAANSPLWPRCPLFAKGRGGVAGVQASAAFVGK
jgi:hypothetical protein